MRKLLMIIFVSLIYCSNVFAVDINLPHIAVIGTATTKVTPDTLNWHISVNNSGGVLQDVAVKHAEIVEGVIKIIKDSGVDDSKIQTSRMEFGENLKYIDGTEVKEGYYASTNITFELKELNTYKKLWITLSGIQHVSVKNVTYSHSNRIEIQNKTRKNALLAAKEKALSLAEVIGSTVGEPLLIESDLSSQDSSVFNMYSNRLQADEADSEEQTGIAPGEITIKMKVKAAFRLITAEP